MSYEEAPGTKLVATNCAICHKPLLDAVSVEAGVGPVCRKKYLGELHTASDEDRKAANKLIYRIACRQDGDEVISCLNELLALGFFQVVKAILRRICKIKIAMTDDGRYAVKTPYDPGAVAAFQKIPGRKWDKAHKVNMFPVGQKKAIFQVLCDFYEGMTAVGPKGAFKVVSLKLGQVNVKVEASVV